MNLLALIGLSIQCALGIAALLRPRAMARLLGLGELQTLGVTEVRATHGAFFLATGLAGAFVADRNAVLILAAGWAAAAACRLACLVMESADRRKNALGLLVEGGIACLLFAGGVTLQGSQT